MSGRKNFKTLLVMAVILLGFGGTIAAVDSVYANQPTAFTHAVQPVELVERIVPEPIDLQAVQLEDQQRELEGAPYRFAIPRQTLLTVDKNGTWEQIDDETWLWLWYGCVHLRFDRQLCLHIIDREHM